MNKLINSLHGFWIVMVVTLLSAATPFFAIGDTYYVSSAVGSDTYTGTAPARVGTTLVGPWKTLTKASEGWYSPGDTLALKSGSVFTNQELVLQGGGDYIQGAWAYVTSYGTGARPRIVNGAVDYSIYLMGWEAIDAYYGTIHDYMKIALRIESGNAWDISRIQIENAQMGVYVPNTITGLYIHDSIFKNIKGIEMPIYPNFEALCATVGCPMWDPFPYEPYSSAVRVLNGEYLNFENIEITGCSAGLECYAKVATVDNVFMDKVLTGGLGLNGHLINIQNATVLNTQHPAPGAWFGADPVMTDWTTGLTLANSEIAYCTNWGGFQDASPVDIDMESVGCTIRDNYFHDNIGSALENNLAGPNHRIAFRNNVCYKNGLSTNPAERANYLKVAFLADGAGHPVNNTCEITDNQIYKSFAGQHLLYLFGDYSQPVNYRFADDFSYLENYAGYYISGNSIYEFGQYTLPLSVPDPYPPESNNLALNATVTVSSGGGTAARAKDDDLTTSWVSVQTTNPWIQYNWPTPQTISRIRLFDLAVLGKNCRSGVLSFSDGSSINVVGGICDNGQIREVVFDGDPKTITWVKFAVTRKVGTNVGLAELQVYAAVNPGPEGPPVLPGNTTLNFSDRPAGNTLLTGDYPANPNGSHWGDADWTTKSVGSNRVLYVDFPTMVWNGSMYVPGIRSTMGRIFIIPHGKRFKSAKVSGPTGGTIRFTQNGLNSLLINCTPTLTTYSMDGLYDPASNIVSCWLDTNGAPGRDIGEIYIDDITYGD